MERKKALAVATASTLILGTALVAGASAGGYALLGLGAHHYGPGSFASSEPTTTANPKTIVKTRDVYDRVVVTTVPEAVADAPVAATSPATGTWPTGGSTPPTSPGQSNSGGSDRGGSPTAPHIVNGDDPSPSPATTVPVPSDVSPGVAPTTTVPPATTSTTIGGRIPSDWPPGKPIPPIPPGCKQPVLEDNGVWNCQNDD